MKNSGSFPQSMQAFCTRETLERGIDLPLSLPDGSESGYSIRITSTDSAAYKKANAAAMRDLKRIAQLKDEDAKATEIERNKLEIIASLVIGWNFTQPAQAVAEGEEAGEEPYPCTRDNVIALLAEAPQIADQIDKVAGNRAAFFKPLTTA